MIFTSPSSNSISQSVNYCHTYLSDGVGVLLLCEVAAKPLYELKSANYNAGDECKAASKLWEYLCCLTWGCDLTSTEPPGRRKGWVWHNQWIGRMLARRWITLTYQVATCQGVFLNKCRLMAPICSTMRLVVFPSLWKAVTELPVFF